MLRFPKNNLLDLLTFSITGLEIKRFLHLNLRIHNFILVLGFVTLGVVTVDLQTELSREREEIEQIIAELSESIKSDELNCTDVLVFSFQINTYFISDENFQSEYLISSGQSRAPPIG